MRGRPSLEPEPLRCLRLPLLQGSPWVQPWSSAAAGIGLPRNAVSGRPYSGINVLILWGAVIEGG